MFLESLNVEQEKVLWRFAARRKVENGFAHNLRAAFRWTICLALLATFVLGIQLVHTHAQIFGFQPAVNYPTTGTLPLVIAKGDFNKDGFVDMIVVNNNSANATLLRGNGDGTFAAGTTAFGIIFSTLYGAATGDFDRDGNLDVVVSTSLATTLEFYYGGGNGTFTAPVSVSTSGKLYQLAVADFNRDGFPDVVGAESINTTVPGFIRLLLLDGDRTPNQGTTLLQSPAAQVNTQSVAVADFDLDGDMDVVAGNRTSNSVSFFRWNSGSNTFDAATNFPVGAVPVFIETGDFNLDGKPDVAVANRNAGTISVLLGDGAGSFANATGSPFATGVTANSIAVGDYNLDGKPDLAVTRGIAPGVVNVHRGNGNGSFQAATTFNVGDSPSHVVTDDFNLDGKPDLATANNNSNNVSVLLHTSVTFVPTFAGEVEYGVGTAPAAFVTADFDQDGDLDFATANSGSNNVSLSFGNGAGVFSAPTNIGVGATPTAVVAGDFNRDGDLDLAVANSAGASLTLLFGNGAGGFPTNGNIILGANPTAIDVGDFDRDGDQDLVASLGNNTAVILTNNGSGGFTGTATLTPGTNPLAVSVADFNRDGALDIVTVNNGSNDISYFANNGSGGFAAASNVGVGAGPRALAVGDFDNDGRLDIAVANSTSDNVTVLDGNGSGVFTPFAGSPVAAGDAPSSIVVGDFNRDGDVDLGVSNNLNNNVRVLSGNGSGGFAFLSNLVVGENPSSVVAGDFNRDGKLDLATTNSGTPLSVIAAPNTISVLLNASPTPAPATIGGYVTTEDGKPVGGITVELRDTFTGRIMSTKTNMKGRYSFLENFLTHFYIVTARSKYYEMTPDNYSFELVADRNDLNFVARPTGPLNVKGTRTKRR